jgi:hypothetical protein
MGLPSRLSGTKLDHSVLTANRTLGIRIIEVGDSLLDFTKGQHGRSHPSKIGMVVRVKLGMDLLAQSVYQASRVCEGPWEG